MADMRDPLYSSANYGNYFQEAQRLNELRIQASRMSNPPAADVVRHLDVISRNAGYLPVGCLSRGLSSDEFFRSHRGFQHLENDLARKITPSNVAEVYDAIRNTENYTPTRTVIAALYFGFRNLFENTVKSGSVRASEPSVQKPAPTVGMDFQARATGSPFQIDNNFLS